VAPTLVKRSLEPPDRMLTLRGSGFFEPQAWAVRGFRLRDKEQCRFNAPSRGRSHASWARLFRQRSRMQSGRHGGGRDGPPRTFGCRAIMIAHARTPGRFGMEADVVANS
jgi:hypothetical protein